MTGKTLVNQKISEIRNKNFIDAVKLSLPKYMGSDRFIRIVSTEVRNNPKIAECSSASILGAVLQSAQLGLEVGSSLGESYLVPYKREVQLIIGYKGMMSLARRSGEVGALSARAVYEGDEFSFSYGLHETLVHVPCTSGARGQLIATYAVARLRDGFHQMEVMYKSEIDAIKSSYNKIWQSHYDEMAKKTAIRRLFKYLPVSVEIQRAVILDEKADEGIPQGNGQFFDSTCEEVKEEVKKEPEHEHAEFIKGLES